MAPPRRRVAGQPARVWGDRIIGIALGVILGIGVVTAFVFLYSEQTVDAPSLSGNHGAAAQRHGGGRSGGAPTPPVRTVRVVGGAPPSSGPAELNYRKGDLVRLRVVSDAAVALQLLGYGIPAQAAPGRPATIRFTASKPGNFPLVVTASHIDVARITVGTPPMP